jgi:hypothetical protein
MPRTGPNPSIATGVRDNGYLALRRGQTAPIALQISSTLRM